MAGAVNYVPPAGTSCQRGESSNRAEFIGEMILHCLGLKNLDRPGVQVSPKLLVCLDCGFTRFTIPEDLLAELAQGCSNGDD